MSEFLGVLFVIVVFAGYVFACNQAALAAKKHGQNVAATFLMSFFFTPATGFLMVLAYKN